MTDPFSSGWLDAGDGHRLYFAQYGCPEAPACVVLHGGPGSSCNAGMLDWFDLSRQRVVLFDQRGAGKSSPRGCLSQNTTQDLVQDIERLRQSLGIHTWLVVGGSWGAMLGLAYAQAFPSSVRGLVLRGVFLPGQEQMQWFFQSLQILVPVAWTELTEGWSLTMKQSVLLTLARSLLHGNNDDQYNAALRWARYEDAVMDAMMGKSASPQEELRAGQLEKYRVQAHYLSQECFITEDQLFQDAQRIAAPLVFVHGTFDWICPPQNLARLLGVLPQARARWVPRGTHTTSDPGIRDALRAAIVQMEDELASGQAIS